VRKSTYQKGVEAEEVAEKFLLRKGFQILSRNWRFQNLEIDIVALDADTLVFIEVKSSASAIPPETCVDEKKIKNLAQAADAFLNENQLSITNVRFDLVALSKKNDLYRINHIPDAFRP
jgi:putative endonuclease